MLALTMKVLFRRSTRGNTKDARARLLESMAGRDVVVDLGPESSRA